MKVALLRMSTELREELGVKVSPEYSGMVGRPMSVKVALETLE